MLLIGASAGVAARFHEQLAQVGGQPAAAGRLGRQMRDNNVVIRANRPARHRAQIAMLAAHKAKIAAPHPILATVLAIVLPIPHKHDCAMKPPVGASPFRGRTSRAHLTRWTGFQRVSWSGSPVTET